ncbi:MAG: SdrD B-like domain-containing protein, partial [Verrucomicrobiota bacterium]
PRGPIVLADGEKAGGADFGYRNVDPGSGVIGDRVWSDGNGNGIQDPGEPGLDGVRVDLIAPGLDTRFGTPDDVVVEFQFTANGGVYLFTGVTAGDYRVVVQDGPGTPLNGLNPVVGLQSFPGVSPIVTIAGGEVITFIDFGYQGYTGSIGDLIWRDLNGDGVVQAGEPGIPGVTVNLIGLSGSQLATATTDSDGRYQFSGLPGGFYFVTVADMNGVLSLLLPTMGTMNVDNNSQADPYPVALPSGVSVTTADFGFMPPPGSIGDLVFTDANGDGVFDPADGDVGLPNCEVILFNAGFAPLTSMLTGLDGYYLFPEVPDGNYFVVVNAAGIPPGFSPGPLGTGGANNNSQMQPDPVAIAGGVGNLTADFGFVRTGTLELGDTAYLDFNNNGTMDGADAGIEGLKIQLYFDTNTDGVLDPGEPWIDCATTDANGNYRFTQLVAGQYLVIVTDPLGLLNGSTPTEGSHPESVNLIANDLTVDFGFNPPSPPVDLAVTKTDFAAVVLPEEVVFYDISVVNTGKIELSGVTVTETVPPYTAVDTNLSTAGWVCAPDTNAGSICTFAIGDLPVGASTTLTFALMVLSNFPIEASDITNTVTVTDDGLHGPDSNPANNTAVEITDVDPFRNVSAGVSANFIVWELSRQTGTYFADLELCNLSGKIMTQPFWYVLQSNLNVR